LGNLPSAILWTWLYLIHSIQKIKFLWLHTPWTYSQHTKD
jgi:hypothetical protein